jgi:preprotein translocase subunit SecA
MFMAGNNVQRKLKFAIIDEVDSILIDEARTPLIISGATEDSTELYLKLNQVPLQLTAKETEESTTGDFWIDEKQHNVILSEQGHLQVEKILIKMGILSTNSDLYSSANINIMHHLLAALKAHYFYRKDQHYVVQNGEVIIVDEFTGRLMSGRRWSDGLHQAVEAKEGVTIQQENQTMASITFQNYFRIYDKLSGMTGTANTEAYEFQHIYNLETIVIPTNKPMIRQDHNDKIYMNAKEKYEAILKEVITAHNKGQPILIGTTSIENSEVISQLLTQAKLKHEVLNAKNHAREAEIIAKGGTVGAITVATNMAGRGTDIVLGGNLKHDLNKIDEDSNLTLTEQQQKKEQIIAAWQEKNAQVVSAGGLYVIGTERHESRRIDNQLRGRSGRQGDPGCSRFYLSLDDSLLRVFGGERMRNMMKTLGMKSGESIEHKWLSKAIENAQRKVEGFNFDTRKQLLDYDNVANDQRRVIYQQRNEILGNSDISDTTHAIICGVLAADFDVYLPPGSPEENWEVSKLDNILQAEYLTGFKLADALQQDKQINQETLKQKLIDVVITEYKNKLARAKENFTTYIYDFIRLNVPEEQAKWNITAIDEFVKNNNLVTNQSFVDYVTQHQEISRSDLIEYIYKALESYPLLQINQFEQSVLLHHIDYYWRMHLTSLEHLRQGIHLRGYAQKDPKQEYKTEAYTLFENMLTNIQKDVARVLVSVQIKSPLIQHSVTTNNHNIITESRQVKAKVISAKNNDISRNSMCPCGSGKKYKHCCAKLS